MDNVVVFSIDALKTWSFPAHTKIFVEDSLLASHEEVVAGKSVTGLSQFLGDISSPAECLSRRAADALVVNYDQMKKIFEHSSKLLVGTTVVPEHSWVTIWMRQRDQKGLLEYKELRSLRLPSRPLLSVVVPIYFEENLIDELIKRITEALSKLSGEMDYELIIVNDGSTDGSLAKMKKHASLRPEIKIVDLSRNFGHQLAITAGIDLSAGDAVIVLDGDLQDPPEAILGMVEKWRQGYQVVYGLRKTRQGETAFKLLTAKYFYAILHKIAEVRIPENVGDFRLMDRAVVDYLKQLREQNRYIRGMVSWLGFKTYAYEYERDSRYAGETKFSITKMMRFALDGITSFSDKPLYLSGYLGLVISLLGMAYSVKIFFSWLFGTGQLVPGWATVVIAVFLVGGVQLICLSIIGQYIGRIYKETKRRPLYAIKDKINF